MFSRSRASWIAWLRGSLPSIRSGRVSNLMAWPSARISSSLPGSGASSFSDFLPALKLSRLFRSDRSSSFRCQRVSRSSGRSTVLSSATSSGSSGRSGASSNPLSGFAPSVPTVQRAIACSLASGLMRCNRARRMSMARRNFWSASSEICSSPLAIAKLNAG